VGEPQAYPPLGREDFGEVTVLRVNVPMLRSDETTEALFQEAYALVEDAGRPNLVLNFDGVVYLASMALGKLVTLMRKARSAGGRLALCKVTRTIAEMLQMTHLADILFIYGDEQEAVRSFA
jgi:anti-sigma B factor antagonist